MARKLRPLDDVERDLLLAFWEGWRIGYLLGDGMTARRMAAGTPHPAARVRAAAEWLRRHEFMEIKHDWRRCDCGDHERTVRRTLYRPTREGWALAARLTTPEIEARIAECRRGPVVRA